MAKTHTFKVEKMHCASCAMIIESDLEDAGYTARCSYAKQIVEIEDNGKVDFDTIKKVVKNSGYELSSK